MKIAVCGGGTAGHITPVLAVVDALRKLDPEVEILFIGSGGEIEKKLLDKHNLDSVIISAGKFRRYRRGWRKELTDINTSKSNAKDLFKFGKGYMQSKKILKNFKPDVVFTKGGYVTVPVGLAAKSQNIPLVIHDSDTVFGVANRILASRAKKIATGFPAEAFDASLEKNKIVFTGNPVRNELLSASLEKAKSTFGFKNNKPIVFIFAGSQGAEAMNNVIFDGLELILKNYNLIHHTGSQGIERARIAAHNLPPELTKNYRPYDFLDSEMTDALFVSDVAVIRPSASSIAEVAAHSLPTIMIPGPFSANNHQQKNADFLEKMGAARTLDQSSLSAIRLCSEIDKILSSESAKKYLQTTIHEFWLSDSAERIARLIVSAVNK
jgi:UDP-N-acetylglucosamine--N-acetylmuramyl-(pentapeptide) pyrophosphoryl-undecaprenol N-acetylglucosamine transferase